MVSRPVLIRTEGNGRIGAGHVGRCLAIASALSEIGVEARFALSSESLAGLVRSRGFPCEIIGAEIGEDHDAVRRLMIGLDAKMIVVDSYLADGDYMAAMREICPTFSFGSVGGYSVLSDIICFYGFHAVLGNVEEQYAPLGARCLIGPAYAPLQQQYWDPEINELRDDARDILITSGGTDPLGICRRIAGELAARSFFSDCSIHVAVGPLFGNIGQLQALAAEDSRVILHEGTELIDLLSFCDLAVCSSGTSVYEVMRLGIPAVFYSFVDNQVAVQDALAPYGHVGDIRDGRGGIDSSVVDAIVESASDLMGDLGKRAKMRAAYLDRVDGQGARRIAREMADYLGLDDSPAGN